MTVFLIQIAEITLSMSAVILIWLLLSKIFGAKFSAKCRYIVWTLVILRLCVPIGISGIPSLITFDSPFTNEQAGEVPSQEGISGAEAEGRPSGTTPQSPPPSSITPLPNGSEQAPEISVTPITPAIPSDTAENSAQVSPLDQVTKPAPSSPADPQNNGNDKIKLPSAQKILFFAWLAGALIFSSANLAGNILMTRSYLRKKELCDTNTSDIYNKMCQKYKLKRPPALYVCPEVESPLLCGFFKPTVMLPQQNISENALEGILAHELTHYRRRDIWIKLACLIAQSLSFFNPLVHIAAKRCNAEMELSCDEYVLAGASEEVRRSYGKTMLDIIKGTHIKRSPLTTRFNPQKNAVKERFMNILDMNKKKRGSVIIALALILCITAGIIVGCEPKAEPQSKDPAESSDTADTESPETVDTEPQKDTSSETEKLEPAPPRTMQNVTIDADEDAPFNNRSDMNYISSCPERLEFTIDIPSHLVLSRNVGPYGAKYLSPTDPHSSFAHCKTYMVDREVQMNELAKTIGFNYDVEPTVGATAQGYPYAMYAENRAEGKEYRANIYLRVLEYFVIHMEFASNKNYFYELTESLDSIKMKDFSNETPTLNIPSNDPELKSPYQDKEGYISTAEGLDSLGDGKYDTRVQFIKAFLTSNGDAVAKLMRNDNEVSFYYSQIQLEAWGAFSEKDENGDEQIYLCFLPTESPRLVFSDGIWNCRKIEHSMFGIEFTQTETTEERSETAKALATFLSKTATVELSEENRQLITCYILSRFGRGITLKELQDYAEKHFGFKDFKPNEVGHRSGNLYVEWGHGGTVLMLDVWSEKQNEDGTTDVCIQFYSDISKTLLSCYYTYKVRLDDGELTVLGFEKEWAFSNLPLAYSM